jgi:hypothetical protein
MGRSPSSIQFPPPVFLGFIAKKHHPVSPKEWGGAKEICSVSRCIAAYPVGWDDDPFDPPEFNRAHCLATADDARQRILELDRYGSRIYALRLIPAVFAKESRTPLILSAEDVYAHYNDLPDLPDEPDLADLDRLGFDVTMFGSLGGSFWGWSCSPLSCNDMFQEHPVNRYCLIDDLDDAVKAAQDFAKNEPEPGPYVIVEVLREATQ